MVIREYNDIICSSPFDEMVTTPDRFVFAGCYFNEEVAFVPWVDNNISAHRIHMDDYSVSFGFGGCYMAKYLYKDCCYISHIHCDSNSPGSDVKGYGIIFICNMKMISEY